MVGDALEFSFQVLKKGTLAKYAELEVETLRLRVECRNCAGIEVTMDDFNLLCPVCGELLNITAGREMQVEYVKID